MNTPTNKQDRYDLILEGSLARRAEMPEPIALEQRLLAVVAEQHAEPRAAFAAWKWSFAGVAAVVLIAVAMWTSRPVPKVPGDDNAAFSVISSLPQAGTQKSGNEQKVKRAPLRGTARTTARKHVEVLAVSAIVKQDVFPSPTPLSEDERMLLSLVRRSRPEAIVAAAKPDRFYENNLDPLTPSPLLMNQAAPGTTYSNTD